MKAAIYSRYSSDRQRESSIADQVRNCMRHAEREGWTVSDTYSDEAISGSISARPAYQEMIADAEAGLFDVLLVDDLSRLSRDDIEMKTLIRRLTWQGLRIIGVSDGYDSSSKGHKVHAGVKGLMNELYLDDLREKTHRGMSGQALKGFNCGGRTYGYRNVPIEDPTRKDAYGRAAILAVRYEIDSAQANVVRQIHEWFAAGHSMKWIAHELNRRRIQASRGGTWALSAVKVVLENEMYEGKLIWNRREWVKNPETGKRTYRKRPESEWIVSDNPDLRIVDQDVIASVRSRQKRNSEDYRGIFKERSAHRYLFSGVLACAHCGGNFVLSAGGRYGCATHKNRGASVCDNSVTVSRRIVEDRLLKSIKDQLLEPGRLEQFKREAAKAIEDIQSSNGMEAIRARLRDSERERDNIMSAIRAGIVTSSTKEALEEAEQCIKELRSQMRQAENINVAAILPRAVERYTDAVQKLEAEFQGHVAPAREIIKDLVGEQIMIHRRGDHLEAELRDNVTLFLAKSLNSGFDSVGCGGQICTESKWISLEPRLSDNVPLCRIRLIAS